jgi:MFS family permease
MEDLEEPRESLYLEIEEEKQDGLKLSSADMKKLVPLLLGVLCVSLNVSIIAPFFPVYAIEHYGASSMTIALIFATYPLASMACAPAAGMLCSSYPRMTVLRGGLTLNAAGVALFGCAALIENINISVVMFFIARGIQGCGCAGVVVSASAFAAANFPAHLGKVIGMQMACEGLGFMIGPPLGGLLFLFGFEWPFLVMSTIALLLVLVASGRDEVKDDIIEGEAQGFAQAMNWQVR